MSSSDHNKAQQVVELLRQTTSLDIVRDFLKKRNLHHSAGSWPKLLELRVLPAIDNHELTIDDLIDLLRSSEESGRQHVFLHRIAPETARSLMARARVLPILSEMGLDGLLDNPLILDKPNEPTIADVRWDDAGNSFVVKVIETKESLRSLGEDVDGDIVTRSFQKVQERVVNIVKLSSDGLLEMRVGSRTTGGNHYAIEELNLWKLIYPLLERQAFSPYLLSRAKDKIWSDREGLSEKIRQSDATLKDDYGYSVKAATGSPDAHLADNPGVSECVNTFISHNAYCDSNNIYFKKMESGVPSKDIHVLISGDPNEFAVTVHCQKADFDYVLRELRLLNT